MLNHITIMGRLTRDPELRRTGSGIAVASFTLAVDRDYSPKDGGERETDFIDCVAWRQTGEFVSKYFTKGRMAVCPAVSRSVTGTTRMATSAAARKSLRITSTSATASGMTKAAVPPMAEMLTAVIPTAVATALPLPRQVASAVMPLRPALPRLTSLCWKMTTRSCLSNLT